MECAWISEEDEMAFSPENQAWIRTEIQNALDKAFKGLKPPSGFRKALYTLREWGVLAADIALIATLGIFAATQWNAANKRLADESAFQKGTDDRLRAIEVALKDLQHPSPLQAFTTMDPIQIVHELGKIADAVSAAQKEGITDKLENIDAVQQKLVQLPPDAPDASRAVSSVISYASFVRAKTGAFPNAEAIRANPCNAISIGNGPKNVIQAHVERLTLTGCGQKLDGLSIKDSTIRNAIITYDGGAVDLENVTFINCLFLISLPVQPSAPATRFADEILTKNTGPAPKFTISVG